MVTILNTNKLQMEQWQHVAEYSCQTLFLKFFIKHVTDLRYVLFVGMLEDRRVYLGWLMAEYSITFRVGLLSFQTRTETQELELTLRGDKNVPVSIKEKYK